MAGFIGVPGSGPSGDYIPTAQKGAANGVAPLGVDSRVPHANATARRVVSTLSGLTALYDGEIVERAVGDGDDDLYYWYSAGSTWRKAGV